MRQRDVEMHAAQGEAGQLSEAVRLAIEGTQREAAATGARLETVEARCSRLLMLLEAAHVANSAGAAQLAVARAVPLGAGAPEVANSSRPTAIKARSRLSFLALGSLQPPEPPRARATDFRSKALPPQLRCTLS